MGKTKYVSPKTMQLLRRAFNAGREFHYLDKSNKSDRHLEKTLKFKHADFDAFREAKNIDVNEAYD